MHPAGSLHFFTCYLRHPHSNPKLTISFSRPSSYFMFNKLNLILKSLFNTIWYLICLVEIYIYRYFFTDFQIWKKCFTDFHSMFWRRSIHKKINSLLHGPDLLNCLDFFSYHGYAFMITWLKKSRRVWYLLITNKKIMWSSHFYTTPDIMDI